MKRNVYLSLLIHVILFIFLISGAAAHTSAEENLAHSQQALRLFDLSFSLNDRMLIKNNPKPSLSSHLQKMHAARLKLVGEKKKWGEIVSLKKGLLALPSNHSLDPVEADLIAQTTIETFEASKKEFAMIRPAALNNIFVNMKLKNKGLCWHWAQNLLYSFQKLQIHTFSFHWITAYEGKLREHNAIAIYPGGRNFQEGLVLDGWRYAGKPFWIPIKDDHFPWKWGEYLENNQNDKEDK